MMKTYKERRAAFESAAIREAARIREERRARIAEIGLKTIIVIIVVLVLLLINNLLPLSNSKLTGSLKGTHISMTHNLGDYHHYYQQYDSYPPECFTDTCVGCVDDCLEPMKTEMNTEMNTKGEMK